MLLVVSVLAAGCRGDEPDSKRSPQGAPDVRGSCGPLAFEDVRGRPPRHLATDELARFPNDRDACAGVWLRTGRGFVPQGLAVEGRTAWVSGFDGNARVGYRFCRIERIDLRTGRRLDTLDPVTGQVGDRPPVGCRHGGGLVRDEHGLWLVETGRLWLIDPDALEVERAWALAAPLRGSFALHDDEGRLGIGRWHPHRKAQVDWFETDDLVASTALDITEAMSSGHTVAPRATQGAVWVERPWFAQSVTRCGVLSGPGRRGFVPGAEGMALVGKRSMWVVSEAGTRHYQELGGRPVVPQLIRMDVSRVRSWSKPDCDV